MWHPLFAKAGTNFGNKRWSLGRYNSLADSGHGVCLFVFLSQFWTLSILLCNILIELAVPMKLVQLIKMCLNETYSKVRIDKHLSDSFHIKNGLKQGDAL
jgi:hypothetical protein